jgi:hypothetical protein
MVIARRVVKQKAQLLIAIPPEYRRQLRAAPGAVLYWHPHRDGEAVVSVKHARKGGKAPHPVKSAAVAALEAEVTRLEKRLEQQRSSIWNEYASQEYMRRLHIELKGIPELTVINDRLRRIEEQLGMRWPLRLRRPARQVSERRGTEVVELPPQPEPVPSAEVRPGGADASGA